MPFGVATFISCLMALPHCGSTEYNFMKNHSVISISGWPQSGTSLLHEFLEHTPGVSTMIDRCQNFSTLKKCVGFNFEGQWILPGMVSVTMLQQLNNTAL
jgi:hypothetical protein